MKYKVVKEFTDRFNNNKYCAPGEAHEPKNKERADQLVDLGFIEPVHGDDKGKGKKPEGDEDAKKTNGK